MGDVNHKLETLTKNDALQIARVILIVLVGVWMIFIFSFSADTNMNQSLLSEAFLNKVTRLIEVVTGGNITISISDGNLIFIEQCLRKIAHMFIYYLMATTIMLFLLTFKIRFYWCALHTFIFCFLYACSDEFHQIYVPGRGPSFRDVIIDTFGASLGIMAAMTVYCIIHTIYARFLKNKFN